uniref:Uncharacterized protein n=1 Tax=Oryza rufipogon TaxID=4529 RepID=A0A0E0PQ54_ORYRU
MVDMQFSHFYGVGGLKSGATLTRTRRSPPASSRRSAPAPVGTSSTEASGVVEEGVVRVGRQGWSWTGRRGVAPALRFDGRPMRSLKAKSYQVPVAHHIITTSSFNSVH